MHTRNLGVSSAMLALLVTPLASGCDCGGSNAPGDVGSSRPDVFVDPAIDANLDAPPDPAIDAFDPTIDAFDIDLDAFIDPTTDVAFDPRVDAGPGTCRPASCAGRIYACGNCRDDDGDGAVDAADPGCIGPCDDTEDVYDIGIGDTPTCLVDCYYDQDQGPGNDGCRFNQSCDPLAPDAPRCPYDPRAMCERIEPRCGDICGPLVPNGCDCFGCCELPPGSGQFVYLGSEPRAGAPRCSPETVSNPDSCRRCTPVRVPGCFNECGPCELCLGRTSLPPECFPPSPADAAVPDGSDAGPPRDAASPDAGSTSARCPRGEQPCGLPSDPPCPESAPYCLTGCCIDFG